jgi:hypothetical protein
MDAVCLFLIRFVGGKRMKGYWRGVSIGLVGLFIALALIPAAPVQAKVPIEWNLTAGYTGDDPEWVGSITRDDGVAGELALDIVDCIWATPSGLVQIVDGVWWIEWEDGQSIEGTLDGVADLRKGHIVLNGRVTEASGGLAYLDGRHVHCEAVFDMSTWTTSGTFRFN